MLATPHQIIAAVYAMAEERIKEGEKPGTPIGIQRAVYGRVSVTLG